MLLTFLVRESLATCCSNLQDWATWTFHLPSACQQQYLTHEFEECDCLLSQHIQKNLPSVTRWFSMNWPVYKVNAAQHHKNPLVMCSVNLHGETAWLYANTSDHIFLASFPGSPVHKRKSGKGERALDILLHEKRLRLREIIWVWVNKTASYVLLCTSVL